MIQTNPYLQDPAKFRKSLVTSVASSTSIETGQSVTSIARNLENNDETGTGVATDSKPGPAKQSPQTSGSK